MPCSSGVKYTRSMSSTGSLSSVNTQSHPATKIASVDEIGDALGPVLRAGGARKAIVFGSHARGDADEHSDLDLIIIADSDRSFFDRYKDFRGIYDVWRKGLDMLIYTPGEAEEMQARSNPFIERALEEGVVIYEEQ